MVVFVVHALLFCIHVLTYMCSSLQNWVCRHLNRILKYGLSVKKWRKRFKLATASLDHTMNALLGISVT